MTAFTIATNNGDIAGGEVMLFALASAARDLGCDVTVVAPTAPGEVLARARAEGFRAVEIRATNRAAYLWRLRAWDRAQRQGLLWCNGLVPSFATAGRPGRVVHLHQAPHGRLQPWLYRAARRGASRVVVPSRWLAGRLPGTDVLANWCDGVRADRRARPPSPAVIGFLGRLSGAKGLDVLAEAVRQLSGRRPVRLLVAGDERGVADADALVVRQALTGLGSLVEEAGWVSREEFFARVDVAVFPSVFGESFGLVAAEAMSARVPFVVSDAGALAEVAGPDHRWVAAAGDAGALADVIERALDEVTPADLDAAHARWAAEFSPAAGARRLARLLAELGVLGGHR